MLRTIAAPSPVTPDADTDKALAIIGFKLANPSTPAYGSICADPITEAYPLIFSNPIEDT